MTVVAYRRGMMAADTRITLSRMTTGNMIKIAQAPDGTLAGAAGACTAVQKFLDWARGGFESTYPSFTDEESFTALVVDPNGTLSVFDTDGHFVVTDEFYAIGSGAGAALAAMHMGASAETACQMAIRVCQDCGGEIYTAKLPRKKTTKKQD